MKTFEQTLAQLPTLNIRIVAVEWAKVPARRTR